VDVGRNEIDVGGGETSPQVVIVSATQGLHVRRAERLRLVRHDDEARARHLQLDDAADEIVRGSDNVWTLGSGWQITQRKRDVVAAGTDQIKSGGIGDAVVR